MRNLSGFQRTCLLGSIGAVGLIVILGRHEITGLIFQQNRFRGRPTSYWKSKLQEYPIHYNPRATMTVLPGKGGPIRQVFVDTGVLGRLEEPPQPEILGQPVSGDRDAIPVVKELFADKDPHVRFLAACALRWYGGVEHDEWIQIAIQYGIREEALEGILHRVSNRPDLADELRPDLQQLLEETIGTPEYERYQERIKSVETLVGISLLRNP